MNRFFSETILHRVLPMAVHFQQKWPRNTYEHWLIDFIWIWALFTPYSQPKARTPFIFVPVFLSFFSDFFHYCIFFDNVIWFEENLIKRQIVWICKVFSFVWILWFYSQVIAQEIHYIALYRHWSIPSIRTINFRLHKERFLMHGTMEKQKEKEKRTKWKEG